MTTIKRRFADEPRTYQTFLEILHTYQKEQRGIKEVLEQVSALFADHPDLLKEFTFFLPDAVQEQAKERLHRAAADSEARQAAALAAAKSGAAPPGGPQFGPPSQGQPQFLQRQGPPLGKAIKGGPAGQPQRKGMPGQPLQQGQQLMSMQHQSQQPPPTPTGAHKFIDMTKPHQAMSSSISDLRSPPLAPTSGTAQPSPTSMRKPTSPLPNRKRPFSPGERGAAMTETSAPPTQHPPPLPPLHHPPQPETFVYNAGVERQFFDATKEALSLHTRDGGQAWAEFLKCLDMYAQEVLSRDEMLGFVEPLLGKRNAELFEEFKRILTAAGSAGASNVDDAWHSVPLSEIDFSRCRRCTPSYRALPRDYPAPPCSERSEEERKVLNDVWVSLPVGSEESYTFRHMRKNQYEEVLFRCEDERFEIDMCIDSNAATLRRLEPIAEEIGILSQRELVTPHLSSSPENETTPSTGKKNKDRGTSSSRPCQPGAGLGGKIFQYTLDPRTLGVIHKHAIARIYGDAGPEMYDLLFKNPAVAVPVVVKRLRQKEKEWLAAREVLNRRWKELAEINYYKSLDHRSLTWRTTDKRATSTRTLVAEIKDRAAHGGNEGETALVARREKSREEHGSFYEITMGRSLSKKPDVTGFPKPTKTLFTPHLTLTYESNSWAQRDAYRIIAFALERGAIAPGDKERCHRLWRDFLGPWFGLGLGWMQKPAVSFAASRSSEPGVSRVSPSVVSKDDDESNEDSSVEDIDTRNDGSKNVVSEEIVKQTNNRDSNSENESEESSYLLSHQPIPPGAQVSTLYGLGTIIKYRPLSNDYVVALPTGGTSYLRPNAVLCTILNVETSPLTNELRNADNETLERATDHMIIGTQSLYLFFRLHQVLVRRLNIAKRLAYKVSEDKTLSTLVEQMSGNDEYDDVGRRRYDAYLSLVYALVEGGSASSSSSSQEGTRSNAAEGGKYEDRVRCLLGHAAYELATMDKLIGHILKNLQNLGSDDMMQNLVQLYRRHKDAGAFKPTAFKQEASYLSDGENLFAFQYCTVPDSTDRSVMYFEFLGCIAENEEMEDVLSEAEQGGGGGRMGGKKDNNTANVVDAEERTTNNGGTDNGSIHAPTAKRQRR